jgi:hypothetical protein
VATSIDRRSSWRSQPQMRRARASVRQIASVSPNVVDTLCHRLLFSAVSSESGSAFVSCILLLTKTW